MLKNQLLLSALILIIGASCKKKSEDTPLAIVVERLEISPASNSILKAQNFQFTLKYFNNVGIAASLPSGIIWTSSHENVAKVDKSG
jgi:hypothetical protein